MPMKNICQKKVIGMIDASCNKKNGRERNIYHVRSSRNAKVIPVSLLPQDVIPASQEC